MATTLRLDHVFIFTPPGAFDASRLVANGFLEGSSTTHPGQGTANRCFFFNNAYLELIWPDHEGELKSPVVRDTRLWERSRWRELQSSPFGIGLGSERKGDTELPFNTWPYRPPYVPPNKAIPVAENSTNHKEPLVFFFPPGVRPDSEPVDIREPLEHPNGARNITCVKFTLPFNHQSSSVLNKIFELGLANFANEADPLMEIILDNFRQGNRLDMRPDLPLVLYW